MLKEHVFYSSGEISTQYYIVPYNLALLKNNQIEPFHLIL